MTKEERERIKIINRAGPRGLVALMAYIGAAIYFIQNSSGSFGDVVLGLLQALVWPVYVIYHLLGALGA